VVPALNPLIRIEVWYSVTPATVIGALTVLLALVTDFPLRMQPVAPLGVPHCTAPAALATLALVSKVTCTEVVVRSVR
jgi:hypothetical protein